MTLTSTEELVTNEVKDHINKLIKDLGIKKFTVSIEPGSVKGDNYLGIIGKVQVNGENQNGKITLNLIVKSAPRQEGFRAFAPIHEAYGREIYMYSKVFVEFAKFQQERGVLQSFKSIAKYYSSTMDNMNEALIMEDMKSLGYEMRNRHEPLDYNHISLVMREYGKFHALSYALRDQEPDVFEELAKNSEEIFFNCMKDEDLQKTMVQQSEKALKSLCPFKDKIIYDRYKKFQEKMIQTLKESVHSKAAGKYAVISHGDCWVNNMLFKYENPQDSKFPTKVCLLDWQLAHLGSPALDLSYFLFTCSDKTLRDEHYNNLIKEYYHSLSSFLRKLGSDPEKLFPYEVLLDHLKRFSVYGLYMATMVLFMMTSEVDEIPDLHSMENIEDVMEKFQYDSKNVEKYNSRIGGVIRDFVKYDYDF